MATYNFTVRAEDDRGAFSDRTFSIQVQNNLVDRMLVVNPTDAYSSVDGVNFTKRTGMGGYYAHYLLNQWVVVNSVDAYRISKDTINWTNANTRVKTDSALPDADGELFYTDLSCLYEYGGVVYAIGKFWHNNSKTTLRNKFYVFTTTDLENWDIIPESNSVLSSSQYDMVDNFSNITRYKGEFLFYHSRAGRFLLTSDFKTYTYKTVNDITATPLDNLRQKSYSDQRAVRRDESQTTVNVTFNQNNTLYFKNIRLTVVNDVVQVAFVVVNTMSIQSNINFSVAYAGSDNRAMSFYGSVGYGCVYTTDLLNISNPLSGNTLSSPALFNTVSNYSVISNSYSIGSNRAMYTFSSGSVSLPTIQQINDYHRSYFTFSHSKPTQYINGDIFAQIPFIGGLELDNPLSVRKHNNTISINASSLATLPQFWSGTNSVYTNGTERYKNRGTEVLFNGKMYSVYNGSLFAPNTAGVMQVAGSTHPLLSQMNGITGIADIAVRR